MTNYVDKERAIRAVVRQAVEAYASAFSDRHLSEVDDEEGTINMKIHNVFIAALGADIQYYSALARSLDSSLGNMLEKMAINIASINYVVNQHVEGPIYQEQTDFIAELLECYKNTRGVNHKKPSVEDYLGISKLSHKTRHSKRHESDYYLMDPDTGMHYLIELKIGGDLDNKKARSEKEALLEQYCILANSLGTEKNIKIYYTTAYEWRDKCHKCNQWQRRQYFTDEEMLSSDDFWNLVCKNNNGIDIVIDEYKKNIHKIKDYLIPKYQKFYC